MIKSRVRARKRVLWIIWPIVGSSVIAGCAFPAPYVPLRPGDTLVLTAPIRVPAGKIRIWFRDGQRVEGKWVAIHQSTCSLVLDRNFPESQLIKAGGFRINGIRSHIRQIGKSSFEVVSVFQGTAFGHAPIREVTCRRWTGYGPLNYGPRFSPPSAAEIRRAFGGYLALHPSTPPKR